MWFLKNTVLFCCSCIGSHADQWLCYSPTLPHGGAAGSQHPLLRLWSVQQRHPLADNHTDAYVLIDVCSVASKCLTVDEITQNFELHAKITAATLGFKIKEGREPGKYNYEICEHRSWRMWINQTNCCVTFFTYLQFKVVFWIIS